MAAKRTLFGLFLFMLCCAAVYYASQFHIVHTLTGDADRRRVLAASRLKEVYEKQHTVHHHRSSGHSTVSRRLHGSMAARRTRNASHARHAAQSQQP